MSQASKQTYRPLNYLNIRYLGVEMLQMVEARLQKNKQLRCGALAPTYIGSIP